MDLLSLVTKENLLRLSPKRIYKVCNSYLRFRAFDMEPIIVGGAPRSGTTLLLAILGAHSAIHSVNLETTAFSMPRNGANAEENHRRNMHTFLKYLLTEEIDKSSRRWCEKTPNNVHHFKLIDEEFQQKVRMIHIIRDGRDIVTSRHPTDLNAYFTDTIDWVNSVKMGLRFKEHPRVHTLKYEDILSDFDATMGQLIAFLDLDWEPGMRSFEQKTTVSNNHALVGGKVQALYTKSMEKWRKPEHIARIDEFYANKEAVALLESLGYDASR